VNHRFGRLEVLHNLFFSLKAGEKVALIGPNGAGKTTLINILTGFLRPSSGSVSLLGQDVTCVSPQARVSMGLGRSFQVSTLMPHLSLLVNVLLAIHGVQGTRFQMIRSIMSYKKNVAKAQELLELIDLWEERHLPVNALSHGQQRQAEIILSLASDPRILLLDEPSAGLTSGESRKLISMIHHLVGSATVLLSAHDMDLVFGLAERVLVLCNGQLIAQGSPKEIQASSKVREIYLGVE
jgi:branched-chain amino acid transport system ATP-binding protein